MVSTASGSIFRSFAIKGSLALAALSAIGAVVFSGCGSDSGRYYCDPSGCYTCDGYGCSTVTPPPAKPCTGNASCPVGSVCTSDGCQQQCSNSGQCPQGTVCTSGGTCAPPTTDGGAPLGCTSNNDCAKGTTCDTGMHTCVACGTGTAPACPCTTGNDCQTGQECYQNHCVSCGGDKGPCPCTTNGDCGSGLVCSNGSCTAPGNVCTYNSDCAPGKVCDNGQCVAQCSAQTPCPMGFTCDSHGTCQPSSTGSQCTSNAGCSAPTPECVNGQCVPACGNDGQCPAGDYCNQGACVPDTRPTPNCTMSSQCSTNQTCLSGYCRFECQSDSYCLTVDTRLGKCVASSAATAPNTGICMSPSEANPMCTTAAQCQPGQACIGNVCR